MRHHINSAPRWLTLFCLLVIFSGCESIKTRYTDQPVVPPGARIQLNIDASLPLDENHIYIQNQKIVSRTAIDQYSTYCRVSMGHYQAENLPQVRLTPGEFNITKIRLYNNYIHHPVIYTATEDNYYYPSSGVLYRTELHLSSNNQPQLRSLDCIKWKEDYFSRGQYTGYYPNLAEFKNTLGDLVEFR